jgi:hypothetical protein
MSGKAVSVTENIFLKETKMDEIIEKKKTLSLPTGLVLLVVGAMAAFGAAGCDLDGKDSGGGGGGGGGGGNTTTYDGHPLSTGCNGVKCMGDFSTSRHNNAFRSDTYKTVVAQDAYDSAARRRRAQNCSRILEKPAPY